MNRIAVWIVGFAFATLAAFANAQAWPSKPIKWVVPFAPGGTTDVLARVIGEKLAIALGQPVIIENKPGAGGGLGAEPVGNTSEEFTALVKAEVVKWADVVKKSGAKVD